MAHSALTVVGFASGSPMSVIAMRRVAREQHLAAIVMPPAPPRSGWSRLRGALRPTPPSPLATLGVPCVAMQDVPRFAPDALLVASFPRRIPVEVLSAARWGAFNVHMSLLPRHRGADPVFSTYWDDDREAGVSVHWLDAGLDTGPVAAQEAMPLPRGLASRELYLQLAERGAELASRVLTDLASGRVARRAQDSALATQRSAARLAALRVPLAKWGCERVWHALAGLGDQRHGLLARADGRVLAHGRATAFRLDAGTQPGRIERGARGWDVHCRDGIVAVDAH